MDDGEEPARAGAGRRGQEGESAKPPRPEDDFQTLAEDWIAIWQSEITAYLTDPETQQAWGAMMAIWAGAAQAMMRIMQPPPGYGAPGYGAPDFGLAARPRPARPRKAATDADERRRPPEQPEAAHPRPDDAPRPASAASAPVARDDEIRRLEQRVAELERSLAEQDRRRGGAGGDRRARRGGRSRS